MQRNSNNVKHSYLFRNLPNFYKSQLPAPAEAEIGKKSILAGEYRIFTHQEQSVDIIMSEEMQPCYLEVSIREIKFVVQVTLQSCEEAKKTNRDKNYISIKKKIIDLHRIPINNLTASFRKLSNEDKTYNLAIIEIFIKDHFFSRRDQLQINQKLIKQTCYNQKDIEFGPVKIQINGLMIVNSDQQMYTYTGIITQKTCVIYRSLESKTAILVEVSQEIFEYDAMGEIAIDSMQKFLKVYQMRNSYFMTNHKLEILLFTRLYFPQFKTLEEAYKSTEFPPQYQLDQNNEVCLDVYRKVSQKRRLKDFDQFSANIFFAIQDFMYELNTTLGRPSKYYDIIMNNYRSKNNLELKPQGQSTICCSKQSNLIEAITLVSQQFRLDYATRSLTNSGHCIVILSFGNGYFSGDHQDYKIAKRNALKNNISCYLIQFGRIPDICSPMFLLYQREWKLQTHINSNDEYFQNSLIINEKISTNMPFYAKDEVCKSSNRLRHAYWISLIKFNDEFLKTFFTLYQTGLDHFALQYKKPQKISFSQIPFTIQPYIGQKEIFFSSDLDDKLMDGKPSVEAQSHDVIQEVAEPVLITRASIPINIFQIPVYVSDPLQQVPQQQVQVQKTSFKFKKTKLFSYYRMKWDLYHWDSKIHHFQYAFKEHYHKLFKQYVDKTGHEDELFKYEGIWKNLTCVPLAPLYISFSYQELSDLKTSKVNKLVSPRQDFEEFQSQTIGVMLSEGYQVLKNTENCQDEYGVPITFDKHAVKFIKGESIITLYFNKEQKDYQIENYNRKTLKDKDRPDRYQNKLLHQVYYKYILYSGNSITSKQVFFEESDQMDITTLLNLFGQADELCYTYQNIAKLSPKGISLVFISKKSLNADNADKNYTEWHQSFLQFFENLKRAIPKLQDLLRFNIVQRRKDIKERQFNTFNLKYQTELPDYISHLHPPKFEQVCVLQQQYWCPKSVFHLSFSWISSGTIPLLKIIEKLKASANQANLNQFQIPRMIEQQFTFNQPFEHIIKLKCKSLKVFKEVKRAIKFPPFDCVHDCSTIQNIYIHNQALFFLKLDEAKLNIIWKENCLFNEEEKNAAILAEILGKLRELILQKENELYN